VMLGLLAAFSAWCRCAGPWTRCSGSPQRPSGSPGATSAHGSRTTATTSSASSRALQRWGRLGRQFRAQRSRADRLSHPHQSTPPHRRHRARAHRRVVRRLAPCSSCPGEELPVPPRPAEWAAAPTARARQLARRGRGPESAAAGGAP
jgi:hypothetical protein